MVEAVTPSHDAAFGGALDNEAILDFVESGRDVILAVTSKVSDDLRNLASDLGVDFEPKGSAVLDPRNRVIKPKSREGDLILSRQIAEEPYIFGPSYIKVTLIAYQNITSSDDRSRKLLCLANALPVCS